AAALAGRPGGAGARAALARALRRPARRRVLRCAPRRLARRARRPPGGARSRARSPAVPLRARVRARRHRLRPVDPARGRNLRRRAGSRPRGLAGTALSAPGDRCRARSRRGAVTRVFLHAFPLDERMWDGFDGFAPRLYGLGESMDEWAESIASNTVLQGEGLAVVGASMGGYCALRLPAHADVRALVLVGARAGDDPPERREARDETIRLIREEGLERL